MKVAQVLIDSVDIIASANDGWTLDTDGTWTLANSSSSSTAKVNDGLNDNFSGGSSAPSGSDRGSLQETLSSSNGATPVATALTETASGSFVANGTPASFSISVGGSPTAPTATVSETNTTDLSALSTIDTDDVASLDGAIVSAIGSAANTSPVLYSSSWTYNSAGDLLGTTLTDSDGNTCPS